MCGITASLALDGRVSSHLASKEAIRKQLTQEIDNSLEIVKHRGPDARGQWLSPDARVGLGHVRLSIIDLSPEGNQPFHDSDDNIHAVVNGELYDHDRLRAELAADYNFKGQSDCEILLALYKKYSLSLVDHLRGEFAFVLWDAKREILFAGRDRYGIKSLYYTIDDGRLLIATEIKSLLAFGWQPEWDVRSIVEQGYLQDRRTLFKNVFKVMPGHYLLSQGYQSIDTKPYWDMQFKDKRTKEVRTEEEMTLGVREVMTEAIRLRLRADVPIGIYLSGGLDSSAVAGIVAHLIKERGTKLGGDGSKDLRRMKCFTVQFDKDSGVDESDIARRTAEWLGVDFVPVHVDEASIAAKLEDTAWFAEVALGDVNGAGKLAMAEKVHALGHKVVLSGEGSDEHFGGYSWFYSDLMREPDHAWPELNLSDSDRQRATREADANRFFFSEARAERSEPTANMMNHTTTSQFIVRATALPLAPWVLDGYGHLNAEAAMIENLDGQVRDNIVNKWHPLHTGMYLWSRTTFQNFLLRYIGDNVDMVHHVESRTPFLDHHVTEYAMGLPPSLKIKYDPKTGLYHEKHILKEAMKPFITDEIYKRKKWPFLGPLKYPEDGPLHNLHKALITKENVEQLGFLDWDVARETVDRAFIKKEPLAFRSAVVIGQMITLGQRFGVKTARPGYELPN